MKRHRIGSEGGQILALMAISATALIGMGALVLDVGVGFQAHRHTQAAADASALAAAQMLPTSTSAAKTASSALATKNFSTATVNLEILATYVANDTAAVTASTTTPVFLGKVLHVNPFSEKATGRAVAGSYTGWSNGLAPWVTDKASIAWGQIVSFKVKPGNQATSGNFGASRLPVQEQACALSSGGNPYRDLIGNSLHSCMVSLGNTLKPETGNLTGPTGQGLNNRGVIQNFDAYSILKQQASGAYILTTYNHPNLVVIPVIDSFHNGNSQSYNVIGFAWFIITHYTNNTVEGMFIGSEVPGGAKCVDGSGNTTSCPFGGYDPYAIKVIQLIK